MAPDLQGGSLADGAEPEQQRDEAQQEFDAPAPPPTPELPATPPQVTESEPERPGLLSRVIGGFGTSASATNPSATENLQPAFDDFRSGVDTYGEDIVRAAYIEQQSLQSVESLRQQVADFEENNNPDSRPNRLTPGDVQAGVDDLPQQERYDTRLAALNEELATAESNYATAQSTAEESGVTDEARDFTRRQFREIPGALNLLPGTNQPRAIAAAINPTGPDGTEITRGEEVTIRRAAATDGIEAGAFAVTVATGPGLLIRAGQGTFRVVSGTAARQSLRETARVTAREGGQEVLEEGFVSSLTSATSGNLPSAGGSASEIAGETILEVLGGRRGRIQVNQSTGSFSVGGQTVQPGQGAYDPATNEAVFIDRQGNATVIENIVVDGSVISIDGVPINTASGPAPAAGFDPGDSSGRTALATRPRVPISPTVEVSPFETFGVPPMAVSGGPQAELPAVRPRAVSSGPQAELPAGFQSATDGDGALATPFTTAAVPAVVQAEPGSGLATESQTVAQGELPATIPADPQTVAPAAAQANVPAVTQAVVPAAAVAATSTQAAAPAQAQAQSQANTRLGVPGLPGAPSIGGGRRRPIQAAPPGGFASTVRHRQTSDIVTDLRTGNTEATAVSQTRPRLDFNSPTPIPNRTVRGRHVTVYTDPAGRASVGETPVRRSKRGPRRQSWQLTPQERRRAQRRRNRGGPPAEMRGLSGRR